jgi:hypothetical protein
MKRVVDTARRGCAETLSHGERVAAEQPGEGQPRRRIHEAFFSRHARELAFTSMLRTPSPVAFGDTLSPWERVEICGAT